ncbi:MAG: hypothetical protein A3J10_01385 [Candidatus Sungbacteria bacterium RIFCSPLOWO2_02_FULL_54_10]|uniref:Uncharacterized protein n=2 Tax=Candidatus Sungiibacteriota TaxID=1817917 RepID=A0A1G2L8X9_9BACT|nr:MAG: hypothetical protein A2679_00885 [Candidatus Sungbacteria bacterium RIFCSPHIGHO2_01_FULL_54_26]OHA03201.1 MAG: hypothetical protein A3C92_01655 [Candidatus Sungbacteria bacterium RIFCSPHIGHO2_02_FULL_53_17]OHA08115.1 MAG: hypothetical protein A3B34_01665 [Candidatus Sungbacteria bacterium RIFCSPLOWO2_01_FULL_54_21]OHA13663.1 MAG: hypothetical protein A3J10_01385 [Candidatus Sungbacteria bacterium RIFCSPLOWO2_02_FULL_54_10]
MQQHASSKIIWLVIAAVVVAGGVFLYYRIQDAPLAYPAAESTSDELSAAGTADLEAELQGMDLENMDAEIPDIEKEVNQ